MKRNRLLTLIAISVISLTIMQSYSGGYGVDIRATSPTPGCSGSGCHLATGNNSNNALKIEVFDANNTKILKYDANTTYKVRISLAKSNVQAPLTAGFQATFFTATSNAAGTFPGIGSNTQVKEDFVNAVRIVTHKTSNVTAIVSGSTVEWEFNWKTPLLGANDIIVSAIANDANANTMSSGDLILQTQLFLPQNSLTVNDYSKGIESIYPNPTTSQLTLSLTSPKVSSINIYSITGQLMKQVKAEGDKVNLDVSDLSNGNYIISITQDGNYARQQFVKY